MIIDWIYSNPTWLWGTILVALLAGTGCLGLVIFNRLVHIGWRREHNDLAGFMLGAISVTYAVLLAFIAIAAWQSYSEATEIVDLEADYVDSIYRDTQGLPEAVGASIRKDVQRYVSTVVNDEWPVQQAGKTPSQGWEPLHHLHSAVATMLPVNLAEAVIQAELLRTLNLIYRARANRLAAARKHIPAVIWSILFLGGALVTGFTYLFGFRDFRMHLMMTTSVVISMALVVVLIIALDWPFRGEVSVSPGALVKTQRSWANLSFEKTK